VWGSALGYCGNSQSLFEIFKIKGRKNEKLNKNYFMIFIINCTVDVRQIPEPRTIIESPNPITDKAIYLGKLEVFTADSKEYTKAWRYTLKSFLINNRISNRVKDLNNLENLSDSDYIIDIEIYPKHKDEYNYWWTWPAIYPLSGYWPAQIRTHFYQVMIQYKLYKGKNLIFEGEVIEKEEETITMYGFYRTAQIEKMIEKTNMMVLDKCAKEISVKL
jgi:hypothetical protein